MANRISAQALIAALVMLFVIVPAAHGADKTKVLQTYIKIAHAGYEDSFVSATKLRSAIKTLLKTPTSANLKAARAAWIASRVPYQQTEVFRFGNKIVDDWEGKVNAWPLDEGLIDYVAKDYGQESEDNEFYTANIIANKKSRFGGRTIDAASITPDLLEQALHEAGGIEANVATGYHAIEFLLWGQDLNGTGKGAGNRPATDFDNANCTNGNCDRRGAYLVAATDLLISDLQWMVKQWAEGGQARKQLLSDNPDTGLISILTGMGSLSYGELAGERMKLGLLLNDPEEEHDCFSDNTHNSHYFDALGIQNVYLGRYQRIDGSMVEGVGLSDLMKQLAPQTDASLRKSLSVTMSRMKALKERAETIEAYDQMIGEENEKGAAVVQGAIDALIAQTADIRRAASSLQLKSVQIEGSDSLDAPNKVE